MRKTFFGIAAAVVLAIGVLGWLYPPIFLLYLFAGPVIVMGLFDVFQKKHSILRNFPVVGHFRYWLELIRPEIQQYFIETYDSGRPFSREQRSVVYQRAKNELDTVPFGTQKDLYETGIEWINHSIMPKHRLHQEPRVKVGGPQCTKPYLASRVNVSAMSYGSLSNRAILALNKGAKIGGFAHNTGEGGLSHYHLEGGGDLIWQIGTGYFGCRNKDGKFSPEFFAEKANWDSVKMIEIKLSQGAKPGHGGILPGRKLTAEIAHIRGVDMGKDVISPPRHSAFGTPIELLEFVAKLRELSHGKPIGFKLCLGKRREFFAICKAMHHTGIYPDFITVDGAEGGTGAAPLEFTNSIGMPLNDALIFVHNALVGTKTRDKIRIIASGKVLTGFNVASKIALGADMCNSARGMMFALGCIQALRCNSNHCPTGVATQDPELVRGLDVVDKSVRVANFQRSMIHGFLEVIAAAGLEQPEELKPWHIQRRVSSAEVKHYGELYEYLEPGALLDGYVPQSYQHAWKNSTAFEF